MCRLMKNKLMGLCPIVQALVAVEKSLGQDNESLGAQLQEVGTEITFEENEISNHRAKGCANISNMGCLVLKRFSVRQNNYQLIESKEGV